MRLMIMAAALVSSSLMTTTIMATEYFTIDRNHTYAHFGIDHMGFSTLYGRFDSTTGSIVIDRENNNGHVDIKISAVSISTGHAKRDNHLRSPDFLNVMEFPDIIYQSRNMTLIGEDKAKVEGDLTLLGVTKPVTLDVHRIRCGANPVNKKHTCGFEATATIKRSDFGSQYGRPNIGDNMTLWFEVEATRD